MAGAEGTRRARCTQRDPRVIALPACATPPLCTRAMPGRGRRQKPCEQVGRQASRLGTQVSVRNEYHALHGTQSAMLTSFHIAELLLLTYTYLLTY